MAHKIPVTKQQLIDIADIELSKQTFYKPHLKVLDIKNIKGVMIVQVNAEQEDIPALAGCQELGNYLADKYIIIG